VPLPSAFLWPQTPCGASGLCSVLKPHQPEAPRIFLNKKKRDIKGELRLLTVPKQVCTQSFYILHITHSLGSGMVGDAWSVNLAGREIPGQSLGIRAASSLPCREPCPLPACLGQATREALAAAPAENSRSTIFSGVLEGRLMPIGNLGPLCLAHSLSSAVLPGLPSAGRAAGDGAARCGSRNCELSHHLSRREGSH